MDINEWIEKYREKEDFANIFFSTLRGCDFEKDRTSLINCLLNRLMSTNFIYYFSVKVTLFKFRKYQKNCHVSKCSFLVSRFILLIKANSLKLFMEYIFEGIEIAG